MLINIISLLYNYVATLLVLGGFLLGFLGMHSRVSHITRIELEALKLFCLIAKDLNLITLTGKIDLI